MIPQQQVVKINPCQVFLIDGTRLCFNPEQIKCIREAEEHSEAGCMLYIGGFQEPFSLACSYDLFLERANVNPQKIEEPQPSDK